MYTIVPRQWTCTVRSASVQGPIAAGGLIQRKTIGQPVPPSPSSGAPGDALEPLAIRKPRVASEPPKSCLLASPKKKQKAKGCRKGQDVEIPSTTHIVA